MKNSRKQSVKTIFTLTCAIMLMATGCEYFKDVVVPKADSTAPNAIATVMVNGEIVAFGRNIDGSLLYRTRDSRTGFIAAAVAQDKGGARSVVMMPSLRYSCASPGSNLAATRFVDYLPTERSQEGEVGEVVSDGVFAAGVINFGQLRCPQSGQVVTAATYSWAVQAEDFHGNVKTMQNARIEYRR